MFTRMSLLTSVTGLLCLGEFGEAPAAQGNYELTEPSNASKNMGEILWDEFGIPHIYGPDLPTVLRGYGYAQMENHAELILQNIALARARSAEYFGPGTNNQNITS